MLAVIFFHELPPFTWYSSVLTIVSIFPLQTWSCWVLGAWLPQINLYFLVLKQPPFLGLRPLGHDIYYLHYWLHVYVWVPGCVCMCVHTVCACARGRVEKCRACVHKRCWLVTSYSVWDILAVCSFLDVHVKLEDSLPLLLSRNPESCPDLEKCVYACV